MMRRSKRELERAVDELRNDAVDELENTVAIAYRMSEGWVDTDGEPVPDDAEVLLGYSGVTVSRSAAEENGWEILGPVETGTDEQYVRVPWDYDEDREDDFHRHGARSEEAE